MTNVLIGKFGKYISFDSKKWGMVGGDSESAILISCMAQLYPDATFYIASPNDINKIDTVLINSKPNEPVPPVTKITLLLNFFKFIFI